MSNEDIINYVISTPENTNSNVLRSMLENNNNNNNSSTASSGIIVLTPNTETGSLGVSYNDLQTYLTNGIVPFVTTTMETETVTVTQMSTLSQVGMMTNDDNSITYRAIFSSSSLRFAATSADEELILYTSDSGLTQT